MNVSSLVIRARPERAPEVRAAIERMPGVAIEAETAAGQIVVVADHDDAGAAADAFVAMNRIEGVLSISLIYQYSDDTPVNWEA
jgi:nitrate reductase NapD